MDEDLNFEDLKIQKAFIRTVVSTGKIMQDGYILSLDRESSETLIKE